MGSSVIPCGFFVNIILLLFLWIEDDLGMSSLKAVASVQEKRVCVLDGFTFDLGALQVWLKKD